jgi:signal transduction histidine kinase
VDLEERGDLMDRLVERVAAVPRNLREDLWKAAAHPVPRTRRLGGDWFPALVVPLVLLAAVLAGVLANWYAFRYQLHALGIVLGVVQGAAVVVVMFRPVLAWWGALGVMVLVAPFAVPGPFYDWSFPWNAPELVLQAAVLFFAALQVRVRAAVEMLVISLVLGLALGDGLLHPGAGGRLGIVTLTVAVLIGASLRGRQVARTELVVQEELNAEERARRTLLEERSRIARELHDVVAHHMSVISIQAQVAPHLVENPSEELKENLASIRANAVEALTELRRVLGVLRSEDTLADSTRHAPQPTLDRLDELVGKVRAAGLAVTSDTAGEPRPLPPGVDLSAYRIVQEALSNAMRHAPGAAVRVEIGYRRDGLGIRVVNTAPDRPAPPSPGAGHGLLGMRERTAMLGGDLATGPTPEGGYEVAAFLPASSRTPSHPAEDGS